MYEHQRNILVTVLATAQGLLIFIEKSGYQNYERQFLVGAAMASVIKVIAGLVYT